MTVPPRGLDGSMFQINDSGEDRRMVSAQISTPLVYADLVVGKPEVEVENVPHMATDESHKARSHGVVQKGIIILSYTYHALYIHVETGLGRKDRDHENL